MLNRNTVDAGGMPMGKEAKDKKPDASKEKKENVHIPLIPMRDESQELEEEMLEAFQEDQVQHKHGNAEPERD